MSHDVLCNDCPPVGYSTDKTRCDSCPRTQLCVDEGCPQLGKDHVCIQPKPDAQTFVTDRESTAYCEQSKVNSNYFVLCPRLYDTDHPELGPMQVELGNGPTEATAWVNAAKNMAHDEATK